MLITPTQDYRRTGFQVPAKPFKGIDAVVNTLFGLYRRRADRKSVV